MINDLIDYILPSVEHFRSGGYWIAFFAASIETTIGIGLIIPGSTIILLLGALSARGYLDVGDLIWFSVLGAIIGDNVNYYLGKKYGTQWLKGGFWLLREDHLEKAKQFVDAHGAKSIFFGRFVPSAKEVVPFIVGSLQMNLRTFMFWNVLGAIGWGCEWVLAGFIFAQSLNLAQLWLSRAGLLVALFLAFGFVLYLLKRVVTRKGRDFFHIFASLCRSIKDAVLRNENVLLWKKKYPRTLSFIRARFDTKKFTGLPTTILALALIYVLGLLAGIVEDLVMSDPIIAVDIRFANLIPGFRTDALTSVFSWITLLGKSQVILVFICISAALLLVWGKKYYTVPLFIVVVGSEAFTYLGKLAFHRPRPESAVFVEHSYSFPSGHATIAVAFYGFVAYLLVRFVQGWNRRINILFSAVFLIIAIGLSRVYLGVHYLSDVWSGYLVGMLWLIIAITLSEWFRHRESLSENVPAGKGKARIVTVVLVLIALLYYVSFSIQYQPPRAQTLPEKTVVVAQPADIFINEEMKYTETLTGDRQEPLNFIFLAKNKRDLVTAVREAGWTLTDKGDFTTFTKAFKALVLKVPYHAAPISPSFWNTKIQDISFAKVPAANWLTNAHHVKIWRTSSVLKNGERIYLAMANANDGMKWWIFPEISPDLDAEREHLYLDLDRTGKVESSKKIQFVKPLIGKNFMGDQFFTDGKAYIITFK